MINKTALFNIFQLFGLSVKVILFYGFAVFFGYLAYQPISIRMKLRLFSIFAILSLVFASCAKTEEPLEEVIERGLATARVQAAAMAEELSTQEGAFPRSYENGKMITADYRWWTAGFFPGVLWQLYDDCAEERFLEYAKLYTERARPVADMTDTHDLGFMLHCSFGKGYVLTGNEDYLNVLKRGSDNLILRYNPSLGVIKSWESSPKWKYPVIIDNMMNLEMLCFVSRQTGDPKYYDIAVKHANTTLENHFREDASTWHVVSYDPEALGVQSKNTAQGHSDDSSWARGQSWALYGYTMMYRETGDSKYLQQARRVARLLVGHPNMPADMVPYWDYNAPDIPDAVRDASSAAVMASALVELSQLDRSEDAKTWIEVAEKQIRSLSSERYLAREGTNGGFILMHSTGSLPGNSEIDVPLTYADYYYIEALLRMKDYLSKDGLVDRQAWVSTMTTIASPVLENLADGTLRKNMPFESLSSDANRQMVSYLEAVGRTLCGIAPWLELGTDVSGEGTLRSHFIDITVRGLSNAVDPGSPDCLDFFNPVHRQPLVDAAFLAEGLLRAPTQVWGRLDKVAQERWIDALKSTRRIEPYESNWLLFSSIIEAFLWEATGDCDKGRLLYGVSSFMQKWYKGDGWYGDGPAFHLDYYNSLVIHPMLTETLRIMKKHGMPQADEWLPIQEKRHGRMASQLEKLISPEGTFPVVGRSIAYRFGALHALADASLLGLLPDGVQPSAVRCAMSLVLERQASAPGTFDENGWLTVGFAGSQREISEDYINTGSCYLCMAFFLPLGLPEDSPFWSSRPRPWTSRKAWGGSGVTADHALWL